MSPGRPARQPSLRNLEIYHELVGDARRQLHLAIRFRLTQPRVAQIARRVRLWVDRTLAEHEAGEVTQQPLERLHLAIALCRLQLARHYAEYLEQFGGAQRVACYSHLHEAVQAGVIPEPVASRLLRRELVQSAVRMTRELDELERVARRGPFYDLPDRLHAMAATAPMQTAST